MLTIIRSFCIVSCIVSGVYGCITYYYFRNAKRMIWFATISFALAINLSAKFLFNPVLVNDAEYMSGFADNIYLATGAFLALCVNIYTGFNMPLNLAKIHIISNYIMVLSVFACLMVPGQYFKPAFAIIAAITVIVYTFTIRMSILAVKSGDKSFIYQIVAYIIMIASTIIPTALFLSTGTFVTIRYFTVPIYIFLHLVLFTRKHYLSIQKTKKLSASLAETIERINHSDNALMCTQMKADFLYRTLDFISVKCDEDPFVAEDLTVALSKYLRHTLNFQQLKGIVPLSNEIELTKAFINIEKERNKKIVFEYKFPDPLPDFHIPPLSIQPIVENAVNHAFTPDQENPKITITIIPYRDYFHIDISDNGVGMDEDLVASLTEELHDSARIGLYNIHSRLTNLFGKGLVIQSAPGVGTSVSFVIPPDAIAFLKEKEKEELA